jgi:hypothetical protein
MDAEWMQKGCRMDAEGMQKGCRRDAEGMQKGCRMDALRQIQGVRMGEKDISARLLALVADDKRRPETARLRDVFSDVEAALNAGVPQSAVLAELHEAGFTMTRVRDTSRQYSTASVERRLMRVELVYKQWLERYNHVKKTLKHG